MNAKIVVFRNGKHLAEFPMQALPSGLSEGKHQLGKAIIKMELNAVKRKVKAVVGNLSEIEFYIQIPSKANELIRNSPVPAVGL